MPKMARKTTMSELMKEIAPSHLLPFAKISIVGAGQVGMACAYSILQQRFASELCLVDVQANKLRGEMMDLQHSLCFTAGCHIKADTDYAITASSKICIITAGARQRGGESRLDLVQRNAEIFKGIIPLLVKHSPNTLIVVVSNPVSVWSGANVAGVALRDINPIIGADNDNEKWEDIHRQVIASGYEVRRLKGYTSLAIGLSVAEICSGILLNTREVKGLSINVQGMHGIEEEVFLSLPCVLGENGVTDIIKQKLSKEEIEKLHHSAKTLNEVQKTVKL